MLEVRARGFGVFVEGGNGHEAAWSEVGEWLESAEESGEFVEGEAVLGVFGRELDLDEDAEGFVERLRGGVEAFCGFEGVESVDGVEDLGGFGGLIVLQRANEMRLRVEREAWRGVVEDVGEFGAFGLPFLDAIFAEEALAGFVGFADGFGGMHLADGHEGDGAGVAVGAGAGVGDFVLQAFEVGSDGHG